MPFAWETTASMIGREWMPVGWYRRLIQRPAEWRDLRTILNLGAAHYSSTVWVNGQCMGEHVGGYFPFGLDVTDALQDGQGELIVRVKAPVDKRFIPHGKQKSLPPDDYNDCAFTASSGIWQSVWLEARPASYIEHVRLMPTEALDGIQLEIALQGINLAGARLSISLDGQLVRVLPVEGQHLLRTRLPVENPRLWRPQDPYLYVVGLSLDSASGQDRVTTYTGLRNIEVRGPQLYLNGERLYIRGVLDQGYWPETGYTAPDDAALRRDIELARAAGYNLIRKHIKCEDPRWLYWADRLGMLVWAEPPCVGRFTPEAITAFEAQLPLMVARDGNHPCIIIWGIYNEEWGLDWRCAEDPERQKAVARGYDILSGLDSSRPVVDNSGWSHVKTDLVDWHYYDNDMRNWKAVTAALARDSRTPFGHRLSDTRWYETHLSVPGWENDGRPLLNGEYGGGNAENQGWLLRWQTQDLRLYDAFCGYIYTELYDVEYEKVGIYDAERQLKDLGCDPATLSAETIIIFDLTPIRPGLDYVPQDGVVEVDVRLSHHGSHALSGKLSWGWQADQPIAEHAGICVNPFEVSAPLRIRAELPAAQAGRTLHVHFADDEGQQRAYGFIDV